MITDDELVAYVYGWCYQRNVPRCNVQDLIQEARLAAIEKGGSIEVVRRAIDRSNRQEMRRREREITVSILLT